MNIREASSPNPKRYCEKVASFFQKSQPEKKSSVSLIDVELKGCIRDIFLYMQHFPINIIPPGNYEMESYKHIAHQVLLCILKYKQQKDIEVTQRVLTTRSSSYLLFCTQWVSLFTQTAFKTFSLLLVLSNWIMMCHGVILFGFLSGEVFWASWTSESQVLLSGQWD